MSNEAPATTADFVTPPDQFMMLPQYATLISRVHHSALDLDQTASPSGSTGIILGLFVGDLSETRKTMLDREAACEIVRNRGWLRRTPQSFQNAVLGRCRLEQFAAGTPVYSVGDKPGGMYGVVTGALGVSVAPGENGPYIAHLAVTGSWFGESAAFTRQPRRVGLTATRDTELLHLPLHAIDEIVRLDPGTWRYFGLLTIGQLDAAIGGSDDLMIRNHVQRFVAVLLRLANCRYASPRKRSPIDVDISHDDLARLANVARTTAGAILRKLETEGHLALSYRRIRIVAPDGLRKMLRD